jgi:uncharacterized protein YegP (UPF0339 family)
MPSVEFYQRTDGKWAWRVVAGNGRIIATDGGQGYENREDCEAGAALVMGGPDVPVETVPPSARNRVSVVIAEPDPE